jgi:hypothetical protein
MILVNLRIVTQSVILKTKIKMDRDSYDDEPVYYCRRCLSLRIGQVPMVTDKSYCEDCGTIDIAITSFEQWDEMYVERYGHHFMETRKEHEIAGR